MSVNTASVADPDRLVNVDRTPSSGPVTPHKIDLLDPEIDLNALLKLTVDLVNVLTVPLREPVRHSKGELAEPPPIVLPSEIVFKRLLGPLVGFPSLPFDLWFPNPPNSGVATAYCVT